MPRTAAKIADFRAILPAGTRVYLAHIDGTDFSRDARHRPPPRRRGLRGDAALPGPRHRRAAPSSTPGSPPTPTSGVREALVIAGGIDRPRGALHRGDAAAGDRRLRRRAASPACTSPATPRATATSTPPAARPTRWRRSPARPASPRETDAADGDRHPVLLRRRPGDRLGRAPPGRGHHAAGPYRRRRPGQAPDADPVRDELRRRPEPCACCSAAPRT